MQTSDDTPKKTSMLRVWEYAVSAAVKNEELAEHEGNQVLQCWTEAEQLQDTNEAKAAKFRKSLSMKFGPAKGGTVYDIMQKRKDLTIQLIQQKQQMKQQQLQQQQLLHSSKEGSPSFGSQEHPSPQLQQQQLMQSGSQPNVQQQLSNARVGQNFIPMQNPGHQQQQQQTPQHGVFSTFNALPAGMGMNSYNNPHQLNNGQILTPISGQMGQMPVGYHGSHLSGPRPGNPTPPPGGPQLGGMNMHIPGQPPMGSLPSQMMTGHAGNNVIFNSNTGNPAFQRPPFNPTMSNAGSTTTNIPKKTPAKRSANAAGMDDSDKKNPKKRPVPQAKPSVPGQILQSGNPGTSSMNRPLNTPGGANFYYNPNSNNNNPAQQSQGSANVTVAIVQPMTVAQEIESWTERPNSTQEGLEPVIGVTNVGGNAVTAPLVTQDFIRQEFDLSKEKLRMGFPPPSSTLAPASSAIPGTAQAMMRNLNIPGAPSALSVHHSDVEHSWQSNNIVDKQMMGRAALKVLQGTDMKIGIPSLNLLSNGIQQHLKTVLESAFKLSKTRVNKTAINSYDSISRMIIEHGHGNALPENQQNIAIQWGNDVSGALRREELEARRKLRQYEVGLEDTLAQKMRAYDEERGKASQRRRPGTSDVDSWWAKEEAAEKEGLLGWSDLAITSFKQSVARKHELGGFVVKSKARSSTGGTGNPAAPQSSSVPEAPTSDAAAVELRVGDMNIPQSAKLPFPVAADEAAVSDAWTHQPCPLNLSRSVHVVMHEDDLALTLSRSSSNRGLPSNTRSTGSCLYNWKMGIYTNQAYL